MRIGTTLTLQFTGIVSVILGIVLVSIYSLSAVNTHSEFYRKLEDRALITANIFLEQDEETMERYREFQAKYLQNLPEEVIQVFDEKDSNAFIERSDKVSFPKETLERIRKEQHVEYDVGSRQVVGIYYTDNQGNFIIIASAVDAQGVAKMDNLRYILLLSFLGSLSIVYLSGRFFSRRALGPIRDIFTQVKRITASNLHLRLNEGNGKDELAELARTFNDMLKRLELAFETQRTFVSNASHELRTPLTVIIGELEVLLSKERATIDYTTTVTNVLAEAEQLKELTNMLLSLAQTTMTEQTALLEDIRLDELLWDVRAKIQDQHGISNIVVIMDALPAEADDLSIRGNRHLLLAALSNILENAVKFSNYERVECRLRSTPNILHIAIKDTGIGIAEQDLRSIFQPFFRGDNARHFKGHGIGLALAEKIIRLHGGTITADSEVGVGTTIAITLPVYHF